MKRYIIIIFTTLLIISIASCSGAVGDNSMMSNSYQETYAAYDGYADYDVYEEVEMSSKATVRGLTEVASNIADTRKIIKNVSLTLETLEFDKAVEDIKASALGQGGYIESSYVSGSSINDSYNQRYASFTIRVPANQLTTYVDTLNANYNVLSINESSSDITDQYYDTEARLNSLLTQEERLLSMLSDATELQYMLQVESTLADVRYQIESYYSTLSRYDSQVSMSTVVISLQEVVKYQEISDPPKTYGQRLGSAISGSWSNFVEGLQDFTIHFVYALPGLLTFFVIVGIIVVIIVVSVKRRKKNKPE